MGAKTYSLSRQLIHDNESLRKKQKSRQLPIHTVGIKPLAKNNVSVVNSERKKMQLSMEFATDFNVDADRRHRS